MTAAANPCQKLRRFPAETLRMLIRLPPARATLLQEYPDPAELLARLVAEGLLVEATRLLAYTLPEREAVWWAAICAEHAAPADFAMAERQAVEAAKAWVWRPDTAAQDHARSAALAAGFNTAGAWAALGAVWSGRTPFRQATSPGHGAEKAIRLASVRGDRGRERERRLKFIQAGIDIASGGAGRLPPEI